MDMENKKKVIICLTASFPYGNKETFFENELRYLADEYDEVIIFPTYNPYGPTKREVPANVRVYEPFVATSKTRRIFDGIGTARLGDYLKDLKKSATSLTNIKKWFNSYIVFQKVYKLFKKRIERINGDITIYSYWAEATLFLTDECKPLKKAVRMHRTDFYLDVNHGYLPLRQEIYNKADLLLPISRDIYDILTSYYKISPNKIFINHLGVDNNFGRQDFKYDKYDVIRIVSCSRVDPIKRVQSIADCLLEYEGSRTIEWHHFGDGLLFEELKDIADNCRNESVRIILHGWATQDHIYDFYKKTPVTWFVNVSLHEGVPVSIMEALSFGIPVIATDVGATRESVSNDNGYLISVDFKLSDLLNMIVETEEDTYMKKREEAFNVWRERFVAKKNYHALIERLNKL